MKIRLVTVVWGREFVETFLRTGLRTLLAEGNAPALAQAHQVTFTIYTTPEDRQLLEANPAFARLRRSVDVQYSLFGIGEIDPSNPGSHGIFWYRAIDLARRRGEVLFFIMPDLLYARGTLLAWARHFENGAKAVYSVGPRVVLETTLPELEAQSPDRDAPCELSRDELLDLLYRNFHPLHAIMRRESPRRFAHPEWDLRAIPGHGVLIREIVSHPFCLDPGYFTNLRYYSPEDHLEALAFEPCSTVSVEPLLKLVDQWYRPWPIDKDRLSSIGGWWDWHTSRSSERESEEVFDLLRHGGADAPRAEIDRAIGASRFYRSQVLIAGRLLRLFKALQERGFRQAATLLAAAIYIGPLRRRIGLRRGAILLVPVDAAFAGDHAQLIELLQPGRERDLLDLIRDHVVLDPDELPAPRRRRQATDAAGDADARPIFTARGERAEPFLSVLAHTEPFVVGPFTIYPVDRILWRERLNAQHSADPGPVVAEAPPAAAPEQAQPSAPRLRGAVRRTVDRYRLPARALARRGLSRMANVSRRVTLALEGVPVLGRSAKLGSLVIEKTLREGPKATLKRVASKVGLGRVVAPLRRRSGPVLGIMRKAARSVRTYGLSYTVGKAARRAAAAVREIPRVKLRPAESEMLDEIRRLRALQAAGEVMADFGKAVDLPDLELLPLTLVRQKLDEVSRSSGSPVSRLLAARLELLTRKRPAWAEAWLELGFLQQDEGRIDAALSCFEHAMRGRLSESTDPRCNPMAIAAANRGRLLAAAGRHAEALASFQLALRYDPYQSMVSVEYAEGLRRSGQADAALVHFAHGMAFSPPKWRLPRLPRYATDMTFKRLTSRTATKTDALTRGPGPEAGHPAPGAAVETSN